MSACGIAVPRLTGRHAGTSLERVIERTGFGIAEQPRDLLQRNMFVFEVLKREAMPQIIEDLAETCSLLSQAPTKGTLAHTELLGDARSPDLAAWKGADELVFHQIPQFDSGVPFG